MQLNRLGIGHVESGFGLQLDIRECDVLDGHFFQAHDISQFTDLEAFCAHVRANSTRIRTSPPKAGVERTYAPGDIENAKAKLAKKGCDWVVANDVSPATGIMGGDRNTVALVTTKGVESWPPQSKDDVAAMLIARIAEALKGKTS